MHRDLLVVNFGGPRSKTEIAPFLRALLTDKEVIRSPWLRLLFRYLAGKRAEKIAPDYDLIGGKSPIYEDTEAVAHRIHAITGKQVLTFHRYLAETHAAALEAIENSSSEEIWVFPMFPQFSYATTGSIARFFSNKLSSATLRKMRWIKSYPAHPSYVQCMQNTIRSFLERHSLAEEKTTLLFSAHGVPQEFILGGDIYEDECRLSYEAISKWFPKALCKLAYQSKFGPGEWLKPYTNELCESVREWNEGREHVVFVPLSFTSDHIETLYEIEYLYLPLIRERGLQAWRCPALNRDEAWVRAVTEIALELNPVSNQVLVRDR